MSTAAARMAEIMADKVVERESCSRDDLRQAGFTDREIDASVEEARLLATLILARRGLSEMWVGDHVAA